MTNFMQRFNEIKSSMDTAGGDWFKFKEGDNKLRIICEPAKLQKKFIRGIAYPNCGFEHETTIKFLTYVYDYSDNKIKLFKLSYGVMNQIVDFMIDPEYAFEQFPMPYDITVKATNAGTKEVKYTIIPARANSEMPTDVAEEIAKKKTPSEIIALMQEKQKNKDIAEGLYVELTLEQRKEAYERRKAEMIANGEMIDYPEDDSDPMDIPF